MGMVLRERGMAETELMELGVGIPQIKGCCQWLLISAMSMIWMYIVNGRSSVSNSSNDLSISSPPPMANSLFPTPRESRLVSCDLATATSYGPPYMSTTCFGSRPDQFPPMYLFVAVSEGLWHGGFACGRLYKIRCLSGFNMPCKGGATVEVKVVDLCRQSPCPSTIAMSTDAFAAISHSPSTRINIEYVQ
ncbi:hypothetical protein TB2_009751 [Malus domestica]